MKTVVGQIIEAPERGFFNLHVKKKNSNLIDKCHLLIFNNEIHDALLIKDKITIIFVLNIILFFSFERKRIQKGTKIKLNQLIGCTMYICVIILKKKHLGHV